MAGVDEALERVRAAVVLGDGVPADAVVAPVAVAVDGVDGQHLDQVDPERDEVVEPLDRRVERAALGERADVAARRARCRAAGARSRRGRSRRTRRGRRAATPSARPRAATASAGRAAGSRRRRGGRSTPRRRRRPGRRRATSRPTPRACRVPGCRPGPAPASSAVPTPRTRPRGNPARSRQPPPAFARTTARAVAVNHDAARSGLGGMRPTGSALPAPLTVAAGAGDDCPVSDAARSRSSSTGLGCGLFFAVLAVYAQVRGAGRRRDVRW